MKGIKIRKGLFKRIPMATELLVGELIYLILGEILIITITLLCGREHVLQWVLGFFEGVVIAVGLMLHMAVSVEDSVSMYEDEALKHTKKNYIIRMIVLLAAFLIIGFFGIGDILAALLGLMALKVSAYIQPFTHKILNNNTSKGR